MYIFFSIFLQWFTVLEISLSNDSVSFLSCNRHLMESRLLFVHSQYPFPHPTYSLLFIYWHEILTTILSSSHTTTRTFCNSCYPELIFHFPEKCCTVSSYRHQFLLTPLFFFLSFRDLVKTWANIIPIRDPWGTQFPASPRPKVLSL